MMNLFKTMPQQSNNQEVKIVLNQIIVGQTAFTGILKRSTVIQRSTKLSWQKQSKTITRNTAPKIYWYL